MAEGSARQLGTKQGHNNSCNDELAVLLDINPESSYGPARRAKQHMGITV